MNRFSIDGKESLEKARQRYGAVSKMGSALYYVAALQVVHSLTYFLSDYRLTNH